VTVRTEAEIRKMLRELRSRRRSNPYIAIDAKVGILQWVLGLPEGAAETGGG